MAITTNGVGGIGADSVATLSNKTLEAPVINNATFTGAQAGLALKFNQSIVFEGTTDDANELTLTAGDPTADRVITLPDATDTLVGKATTDTLTNKSISAATNTITGVILNTLTTTTGDMIYASSDNTPARLAIGSTGQILTVSGGVPAWGAAPESLNPFNYSFMTMGA